MDILIEHGLISIALFFLSIGAFLLVRAILDRNQKKLYFALFHLSIATILFIRSHYAEFWQIDRCLDSGGRYDRITQSCRYY